MSVENIGPKNGPPVGQLGSVTSLGEITPEDANQPGDVVTGAGSQEVVGVSAPGLGASVGIALVERDQDALLKLQTYRRVLRGLNHDIRAPLISIRYSIHLAALSSGQIGSSQTFLKFQELYQGLIAGKKDEGAILPEEPLSEHVLGRLEYWKSLTERDGNPADILRDSQDYRCSVEKTFREELIPCVKELVEEIKRIQPPPVDSNIILENATFVLTFFDNFDKRIVSSSYIGSPENLNPRELTQKAIDSLRGTFVDKQMKFEVCSEGSIKQISMDPAIFRNLLINLFTNAAKASQAKHTAGDGKCVITFEEEGNFVVIRVSDNGPGVSEEKREEIFKEGVSGSLGEVKSTSAADGAGKNEGLGLASVRRDLEAVGGSIHVEEVPSSIREQVKQPDLNGANFVIRLPSLSSQEKQLVAAGSVNDVVTSTVAVTPAVEERRPSNVPPFRILMIDDDISSELTKMVIELSLAKKYNVEIILVSSVEEALTRIQSGYIPHLILADVGLPGEVGPSIKPKLESSEINIKGVQVIAVTGNRPPEVMKEFPFLDGALQKPVDPEDLGEKIISALIDKILPSALKNVD